MATFPTLTPSIRTFTPGRHPHSEIPTLNGLQVRVRTSNVILEQQLRLTFIGLTEAQMLSIRSHYVGQQGRFLSFAIPSSLLSGMTTPSYFTPTGYSWIYGSAPQVEDIPGTQRYNVSVELVTVPPEGANVNGAEFTVSIALAAGASSVGNANATGADLTVAASLESGSAFDTDAAAYIAAVESADGQSLEADVKTAINSFVVGCKADGIWTAIKASCILAGARTLTGALVPLVGTAPTNNDFVSGDYNRETGLVGNGSTKYLDSNRLRTADPQDNQHLAVHVSTLHTLGTVGLYAGSGREVDTGAAGFTHVGRLVTGNHYSRHTCTAFNDLGSASASFFGVSRASSSSYTARQGGSNTTISQNSETPPATTNKIFAGRLVSGVPNAPTDARLAFYSIGESLDLALLDTRVTALIDAIAAAIP